MALYRALRDDEIEAGNVLIPKSQAPFRAHAKLPLVLPFRLGECEVNAIRDHQRDGEFLTRGVSCTREWGVALRYAAKSRVIVLIDEAKCRLYGIHCRCVRDYLPLEQILHPEDEEVILVSDRDGLLPKQIVASVIRIDPGSYSPKNF